MQPAISHLTRRRFATTFLTAVLLCAGAGCKPAPPTAAAGQPEPPPAADGAHPPTAENLRAFFETGAPSGLKVTEVKADLPVHQPDGSWLVNVKLVLTSAEDLLALPTAGDAQSTDTLVGELNRLVRWHDDYARSPYAKACGLFEVHVPAAPVPPLLVVLQPGGKPLAPIYGKVAAEWQVDHWQFQPQGFSGMPSNLGEPRATFKGATMVQGSPEAEKTLREVRDDIAQARKDIEGVRRRYAEQVARGSKPDTTYAGTVSLDGSTVTCELRFLPPPAGSSGDAPQASFQVTLTGMRPACWYVYHARVNTELPLPVPGPQPPTASDEVLDRVYTDPNPPAAPVYNVSPSLVDNSHFDVGRNAMANALSYRARSSQGLLLLDGHIEGVLSDAGSSGVRLSVQQKP